MAVFRDAICLFWLSAIIGADAAGLRARAIDRSDASAVTSSNASPADVEEQEEDDELEPLEQASPAAVLQLQAAAQRQMLPVAPQAIVSAPQQAAAWLAAGTVEQADEGASPGFQLPVAQPRASPPRPAAHPRASPPQPTSMARVATGGHAPKMDFGAGRTNVSLQQKPTVDVWPPAASSYQACDPPCIEGRGLCNDNICFCRSPFSGSTCQHKVTGLYRAPKVMTAGFAVMCFFMGIILSKFIFTFSEHAVETRLQRYGDGKKRFESWAPPKQDLNALASTPRQ